MSCDQAIPKDLRNIDDMEYQSLTSEIIVPKEWMVHARTKLLIKVCEHLINLHCSRSQTVFQIGETATKLTQSATTPKFTFTKVDKDHDNKTLFIVVMLPEKVEIVGPQGSSLQSAEAIDMLPVNIVYDLPVQEMGASDSKRKKYLTVRPNSKKILEALRITGPEILNWVVKTTYRSEITKPRASRDRTDPNPSNAADSAESPESAEQDSGIVHFDRVPHSPQEISICRRIVVNTMVYLLFVILILVGYGLFTIIKAVI